MATVSHGSLAQPEDRMHPFFSSGRCHLKSSRPHVLNQIPAQGIKPNPEAVVGSPSTTTTTEMGITTRQEQGKAESSPAPEFNEEAISRISEEHKLCGYDGALDAEIDPNADRRKRRKITPSFPESNDEWRQQLEDAAHSVDISNSTNTPEEPSSNVPREQPAVSSPRRSTRISISKRVEGDNGVDSCTSRDATPEKPQPVQTDHSQRRERITPKKKMLKLTGKGKLIKSPTPSPKTERPQKLAAKSVGLIGLQHGRIAPSLKIVIPYRCNESQRVQTAEKIDRIIEGNLRIPTDAIPPLKARLKPNKPTHPFFGGRKVLHDPAKSVPAAEEQARNEISTEQLVASTKQPVPWNEMKFSSRLSPPKDLGTQPSLWPPLSLQHVQPSDYHHYVSSRLPQSARGAKQKQDAVQVLEDEDILRSYKSTLLHSHRQTYEVLLPQRLCLESTQLSEMLGEDRLSDTTSKDSNVALRRIQARALASRSAFDEGRAAGPQDWTHSYSPRRADETLHPQAMELHDWLAKHKIHQVQSKLANKREHVQTKRPGRKRRLNRDEEMDGFIASSDDEAADKRKTIKNVIILCGPCGSGKTASVYAAAQELDFEVFEIHPGMRRSAKDIFDKVGDMAHNHLVQPSAALSRDSSALTEGLDQSLVDEDVMSGKQSTMGSFLDSRKNPTARQATPQSEKPNLQKQSLILFEEVDILFEDDKAFWSGVQALMLQSKRPIVLTCNSLESIPLEELTIHTTLQFDRVPVPDAVEYLVHVAAAEGHLLARKDVEDLFLGRGQDLRASLTELNFWCQMTVGSRLGGLDWMQHASNSQLQGTRIISKGTYYRGLDLLPEHDMSQEDLLSYANETFDMSPIDWEETQYSYLAEMAESYDRVKGLEDFLQLAETKSCMDIYDTSIRPLMSIVTTTAFPNWRRQVSSKQLIEGLLMKPQDSGLFCSDLFDVFEPLMEDFRTFPPTTGRGAASLDGARQTVATEVAPYIRSIVAFDQQLEAMRHALSGGSHSSRQRKTRAARAALEGGDKADTRRERWFPKDLEFSRVLKTMPGWLYEDEAGMSVLNIESHPSSQATISEDDIAIGTPGDSDAVMNIGKRADDG